jgi:hypothetical protein
MDWPHSQRRTGADALFSAAMKLAHPPALDEGFAHLELPISRRSAWDSWRPLAR